MSQTYSFLILASSFFKNHFITIFLFTLRAPSLVFPSDFKIKTLYAFRPMTPQNSLVRTASLARLSSAMTPVGKVNILHP